MPNITTMSEVAPGILREAVKMLGGKGGYLTTREIAHKVDETPGQYPVIAGVFGSHTRKGAMMVVSKTLNASGDWERRNRTHKHSCYRYIGNDK